MISNSTTPSSSASRPIAPSSRPPNKPQSGAVSGYDYVGAVLRRKWILILCLCAALPAGYLLYRQKQPVYASTLRLMIWTQAPPTLVNGETIVQPVSIGKHQSLLYSELVLAGAIRNGDFRRLACFSGEQEPLITLKETLSVMPIEDSADTLELTVYGSDPYELPEILNHVVASYTNVLNEDTATSGKESVQLIEKLQTRFSDEKSSAERRYFELIRLLGVTLDRETMQFVNPHATTVEELRLQLTEREMELQEIKERIASVVDVESSPAKRRADLLKVVAIEAARFLGLQFEDEASTAMILSGIQDQARLLGRVDDRIATLEAQVAEATIRVELNRDKMGVRHPVTLRLLAEVEYLRSQRDSLIEQRRNFASNKAIDNGNEIGVLGNLAELSDYDKHLIRTYVSSLAREQNRLARSVALLEDAVADAEEEAAAIGPQIDELNVLGAEIEQKGEVIREILKRLGEISVVSNNYNATKVRVIDEPQVGIRVEPRLLIYLVVAGFFGSLLAFGLIVMLDWSDLSFRNQNEIQDQMGVPVVASLPQAELSNKDGKRQMFVDDQPMSQFSEAVRSCRTALMFSIKQYDYRTLLITSPSTGDGKSTAATNLALSFAQSGMVVTLIDADLRRPRCSEYLGETATPGLKDYGEGAASIEEIFHDTQLHHNLKLISAAGYITNPSEFLASAQFEQVIAEAKSRSDLVIVDSPPVLPVSDAAALSSLMDAVVVVIRIRKGVTLALNNAKKALDLVDANVLGVVVNAVEKGSHYSQYGGSGYNGYGSHQYFADRYFDSDNKKYYESKTK